MDLFQKRRFKNLNGISTIEEDTQIILNALEKTADDENCFRNVDTAVEEYHKNVVKSNDHRENIKNCIAYIRRTAPFLAFDEEYDLYDTKMGAVELAIIDIGRSNFKLVGNRNVTYKEKFKSHKDAILNEKVDYRDNGEILLKKVIRELLSVLISLEKAYAKDDFDKVDYYDSALIDIRYELKYIDILKFHMWRTKKEDA